MTDPKDVVCPFERGYLGFLHCNAQSAVNKHDILTALLSSFNVDFHVIMITETWYVSDMDVLHLPGFNTFFLNRKHRRGGGIAQLVSTKLSCSIISDFSSITDDYEALAVQCGKHLFSAIYRPPDGNIGRFLGFLEKLLDFSSSNKLDLVIGGDCNINILQPTSHSRELQLLLTSFDCMNVITEPTRISCVSETLLDLFITNHTGSNTASGVIAADVSDHLPIFMFCKEMEEIIPIHLLLKY